MIIYGNKLARMLSKGSIHQSGLYQVAGRIGGSHAKFRPFTLNATGVSGSEKVVTWGMYKKAPAAAGAQENSLSPLPLSGLFPTDPCPGARKKRSHLATIFRRFAA
jgi:hypothetical protein